MPSGFALYASIWIVYRDGAREESALASRCNGLDLTRHTHHCEEFFEQRVDRRGTGLQVPAQLVPRVTVRQEL